MPQCSQQVTDRCGWRGYFHHYLVATVDGDWAAAVCDDCWAELHPASRSRVKFFSSRRPGNGNPVAVIRQRDRSDHAHSDIGHFPDTGPQMIWQLWWEHTTMLSDDRRGNCV
jgi:hypothetical protein